MTFLPIGGWTIIPTTLYRNLKNPLKNRCLFVTTRDESGYLRQSLPPFRGTISTAIELSAQVSFYSPKSKEPNPCVEKLSYVIYVGKWCRYFPINRNCDIEKKCRFFFFRCKEMGKKTSYPVMKGNYFTDL